MRRTIQSSAMRTSRSRNLRDAACGYCRDAKSRKPANNATVRNVYVIGPDKKIKLILVYPMTTGRNFDEVLRVIDSLQLTAKHQVATPLNWLPGEDVIIAGSVSDEEAKRRYPKAGKRQSHIFESPAAAIIVAQPSVCRETCGRHLCCSMGSRPQRTAEA